MGEAVLATIVMTLIGAAFVGLMVCVNRRHERQREARRSRWTAMGYGDAALGGGGAVGGFGCTGGGAGGCSGAGCAGGGCGGGGCGGGGCGGGGGG